MDLYRNPEFEPQDEEYENRQADTLSLIHI